MKTGRILSAAFCAGRKHDFQLSKKIEIELPPHVLLLADAGYQGVAGIHSNSLTPKVSGEGIKNEKGGQFPALPLFF
jgi:hypothetical protein